MCSRPMLHTETGADVDDSLIDCMHLAEMNRTLSLAMDVSVMSADLMPLVYEPYEGAPHADDVIVRVG